MFPQKIEILPLLVFTTVFIITFKISPSKMLEIKGLKQEILVLKKQSQPIDKYSYMSIKSFIFDIFFNVSIPSTYCLISVENMYNPEKPYNQLPLLPPNVDLETKAILKQAITSNWLLAELKGREK